METDDMSTDEIMIPLFEKDTDGSTMKKKASPRFPRVFCMGR